jgi:uncharacterized protein
MEIIGRKNEQIMLSNIVNSEKAEFVAVFGRRRIGKTFLIKEYFNKNFTFYTTGLANANTKMQLASFTISLNQHFQKENNIANNWLEAFNQLKIELQLKEGKKIIFIDELPWFDTKKSDFLTGLEFFWNSWASAEPDLKLIACGSAASWMINKLIKNKGGLHNRVTARMKLEPFNLQETEQFLRSKNLNFDRYQIIQLYMVMGGVPYYLEQLQKGLSATQNIEKLCFADNGLLKTEFNYIFSSLFNNAEKHEIILRNIAEKGGTATREAILASANLRTGGDVSTKLKELEESGFITALTIYSQKSAKKIYAITDYYTLFYLKFIDQIGKYEIGDWANRVDDPTINAWAGITFEKICLQHVQQIKNALKIGGVSSRSSIWTNKGTKTNKGAQIDLIIDRRDRVINLCEIKYSINKYTISKNYDQTLRNKIATFKENTKTNKSIFLTMITTFGLHANEYSRSIVQNETTMDQLFEE